MDDERQAITVTAAAGGGDMTRPAADDTAAGLRADAHVVVGDAYEVTGEVGRGGMGRVVRARDRRLEREVALKELTSRSRDARARFEREAKTAARLQHPSIVPIYALAADADGQPYYAMKLVSGRTLRAAIDAAPALADRLALLRHVIAVANAIAYAHSRRVIHRDLKSANVILGDFGETIVIDWGLAKDLAADEPDEPDEPGEPDAADGPDAVAPTPPADRGGGALTQAGAVMGTPAFMAPEQALGERVDERADVYAIGVMLYELVAAGLPFEGGSSAEVLARVIDGHVRPLLEVAPDVPRDLAAIVGKAMERDRDARYPDARELAAELERFAAGQLVAAHRYGARELIARWIRRHRAAVAVGALALAATVAIGTIAVIRVVEARDRAEDAQRAAERDRDAAERARADEVARADDALLAGARLQVEADTRAALDQLAHLSPGSPRWPAAREVAADALARGVRTPLQTVPGRGRGMVVRGDGTVVAAFTDPGSSRMRLFELAPGAAPRLTPPTAIALAVGGATAWIDGDAAVVATATGTTRVPIGGTAITSVAVSEDGARVAAIADGRVVTVDVARGTRTELGTAPPGVDDLSVEVTGGGTVVVLRGLIRPLAAWRTDGSKVAIPGRAMTVEVSPDGVWLAASVWGPGGHVVLRGRDGVDRQVASLDGPAYVAFDRTGRRLIWADERVVHVWDVATGRDHVLRGNGGSLTAITISPDGRWLATAGNDATARLWDLAELDSRGVPYEPGGPSGHAIVLHHDGVVMGVGFEPDSRDVVTLTEGGALSRWHLPAVRVTRVGGVISYTRDLSWSAHLVDGALAVVHTGDGAERRMPGPPLFAGRVDPTGLMHLTSFASASPAIAIATGSSVQLWRYDTGEVVTLPVGHDVSSVALSSDAGMVAARCGDRVVLLRAGQPPRELETLPADGFDSTWLAFSSDDAFLASSAEGGVRIVRVADGHVLALPHGRSARFSSDGRRAVITGAGTVARCDLTHETCEQLDGVRGRESYAVIARDGRVAAAFSDGEVALWAAGARAPTVLGRHRAEITRIELSTEEDRLITSGNGPEVHLWGLRDGAERTLRAPLRFPVALRVDGATVRVADWFAVHELDDDLPSDEAALRARIAAALATR